MSARRVAAAVAAVLVLAWAVVPLARGLLLVRRSSPPASSTALSIHAESVIFAASDGVRIAGMYVSADDARATVVLVHGFKNTRADMIAHALFLHDAGYAVLLFDSRGCGESDGTFGVGATEDRDIVGAVDYLKSAARPGSAHVAVLGVSLGAGDALLAAAYEPRIDAVIADSSWADERVQLERMATLPIGPIAVPLLPYEPALVDALVGARLEDARPRDAVARIGPRPLLFIHSADDENATTPLADVQSMFATAREPKDLWIAPHGGHAGALGAARAEYTRRVLAFLARAFG